MDAISEKPVRNSRWSRDPVVGLRGATVVYPTDRDIEVFELLARFRYLASDYIHAFIGGSAKALNHRLNLLSRRPNLYLVRPPQQRQNAAANYRPLIYALDERGVRALRDRGLAAPARLSHHNFAHAVMIAQIMASLELGARDSSTVRLISWSEILSSERMPQATRALPNPAAIQISYALRGAVRDDEITADARPFGLERTIGGKRTYLFFPGVEADCATEPVDASDPERSSIARKFCAYLAIAEQSVYRNHFGFPNFFVPFITTTSARQRSMMDLLDRLTAGRGSKIFLFKTLPAFASPEAPAPPTGHMLTSPWTRVAFPPLLLDR